MAKRTTRNLLKFNTIICTVLYDWDVARRQRGQRGTEKKTTTLCVQSMMTEIWFFWQCIWMFLGWSNRIETQTNQKESIKRRHNHLCLHKFHQHQLNAVLWKWILVWISWLNAVSNWWNLWVNLSEMICLYISLSPVAQTYWSWSSWCLG